MKLINCIFLAGLLPFLSGCDKSEAVFAYPKEIGFQYVDKEGNILYFDKEGNLSSFDKNDYISLTYNKEDFLKTCPMEILSFTNESGTPLAYNLNYSLGHLFGLGIMEYERRKEEYSYIIQYKIPPITGESAEELRVTLKETKYGFPDGWYNCQYNDKNIRFLTKEELFPDYSNPQQVFDEEYYNRLIKMLYSGELVAYEGQGGSILVIIPVDIVK